MENYYSLALEEFPPNTDEVSYKPKIIILNEDNQPIYNWEGETYTEYFYSSKSSILD